jgi:hypothetical protein
LRRFRYIMRIVLTARQDFKTKSSIYNIEERDTSSRYLRFAVDKK